MRADDQILHKKIILNKLLADFVLGMGLFLLVSGNVESGNALKRK